MRYITALIFFCICQQTAAQTLTGKVTDASNGNPLPWSLIRVANSSVGNYAAADGSFMLSLPENQQESLLIVSHIGYKPDTISISEGQRFYDIRLMAG
ncbi:MAG: carboxypeptidase-like regulatory domain-containing protein, partial [Bacteroidia bacterium]